MLILSYRSVSVGAGMGFLSKTHCVHSLTFLIVVCLYHKLSVVLHTSNKIYIHKINELSKAADMDTVNGSEVDAYIHQKHKRLNKICAS